MIINNSKQITLSINPLYKCNFRCSFCYLTNSQLSSKNILSLDILETLLDELVKKKYTVNHIDLYGGEIALLEQSYLDELMVKTQRFELPDVNVVTNLSKIVPFFLRDDVYLSVSYDFSARERYDEVFYNLTQINKPISILMLASPELLKLDVENIISQLNLIRNIVSVEIKPYSTNQANRLNVSDNAFENYIKTWLQAKTEKKFEFINYLNIVESLRKTRNAYSDNHLYITPNGKFAVLEFDVNNNEYFLELDNIDDYTKWTEQEKEKIQVNQYCSSCQYKGNCLTEHYRNITSLEESCSGFKNLLDWCSQNLPYEQQVERQSLGSE
jgi:MoaA/NifB/PqqE/SkfB family radical SAM enzyme